MKGGDIEFALLIASRAGLTSALSTSTAALAQKTGFSQQSVSRRLREMESAGLIERKASTSGIEVKLTQKGRRELEILYAQLRGIFSKPAAGHCLKGKLIDGLGEGTYYTSQQGYRSQFRSLLGADVYPGTLNLEVNPAERDAFTSSLPVQVKGFRTAERSFGGIDCWPCTLNRKAECFAILPHRTNHPANIIEIIAEMNLRKKLGIKNGDIVEVEPR